MILCLRGKPLFSLIYLLNVGQYDFTHGIKCLRNRQDPNSPLSRQVGSKGYHAQVFEAGPDPVEI